MKSRIAKSLTIAALATSLAACHSVPLDNTGDQGTTGSIGTGAGVGNPVPAVVMDPFDPSSPLAQQKSVFFDFDKYDVKEKYQPLVQMHSDYLANTSHRTQQVKIIGSTDIRGSAEYNLGLGTRRANAVSTMMQTNGVSKNQIEVISHGKEYASQDSANYEHDRRADIDYVPIGAGVGPGGLH
jgi:peptidoglycan-associated lipoprotein